MGGPTTSRDRVPDGGEAEDAGPRPEALATADSGTEPLLPIAWRMKNRPGEVRVLADSYTNVSVSSSGNFFRHMRSFFGVGFMVSVGYMDPGNWAADLGAGSQFGYALLFAVLLSSICAMFLQYLTLKLGVATERDLARACRDAYPEWLSRCMWVAAELAIVATDLAEVIGSAVALNLLTGMPIWAGVLVTAADVLVLLAVGGKSLMFLEGIVAALTLTIAGCFAYTIAAAKPSWREVGIGLLPGKVLFTNPEALTLAVGILGATVMPHNLFMHSATIQTRDYPRSEEGKRRAIRYGGWDSNLSLLLAFFVNAAILVVSGAAFHGPDRPSVSGITDAYQLLDPALGSRVASTVFAVALLASGQNSTITGTLSGQIVMEGFTSYQVKPWIRRLATRMLAVVPAALVAALAGPSGINTMLVFSQVFLSLTLPVAVLPLCHFTGSTAYMGPWRNHPATTALAWTVAIIILALNVFLLVQVPASLAGD